MTFRGSQVRCLDADAVIDAGQELDGRIKPMNGAADPRPAREHPRRRSHRAAPLPPNVCRHGEEHVLGSLPYRSHEHVRKHDLPLAYPKPLPGGDWKIRGAEAITFSLIRRWIGVRVSITFHSPKSLEKEQTMRFRIGSAVVGLALAVSMNAVALAQANDSTPAADDSVPTDTTVAQPATSQSPRPMLFLQLVDPAEEEVEFPLGTAQLTVRGVTLPSAVGSVDGELANID